MPSQFYYTIKNIFHKENLGHNPMPLIINHWLLKILIFPTQNWINKIEEEVMWNKLRIFEMTLIFFIISYDFKEVKSMNVY